MAGRTATPLPPGSRAVCEGSGRGPRRPVRTYRMRVRSRLAPRAPDEHRLPSAGHRARQRGARQKPALGRGLGLEPSCWSGPRTPWAVPVTHTKLRRPGSRRAECCRGLRGPQRPVSGFAVCSAVRSSCRVGGVAGIAEPRVLALGSGVPPGGQGPRVPSSSVRDTAGRAPARSQSSAGAANAELLLTSSSPFSQM